MANKGLKEDNTMLSLEINGKSIIDYARDWVYDTWTGWFK